jgi:hypothetical protein
MLLRNRLLFPLLVLAVGCGRSGPDLQPVSGLVTVNQRPLEAGRILFRPLGGTEGKATSAGIQQGEFTVTCQDGLVPGKYRVEIEAAVDLGFAIDDDVAFAQRGRKPLPPNPVPPKFNRDSTLTASVAPGDNNILEFNLDVPTPSKK